MNPYVIFDAILFCLLLIVTATKKHYHWQYLRIIRKDLVRYKNAFQYGLGTNMEDPMAMRDYLVTNVELLLPSFRFDRVGTNTDHDHQRIKAFIKIIRICSIAMIIIFVSGILSLTIGYT